MFSSAVFRRLVISWLVAVPFTVSVQADDVYVSSQKKGTITKFDSAGVASTFASGLTNPGALAFDASGNLYVVTNDNVILKFTTGGAQSVFSTVQNFPHVLAFDSAGNLYAAGNNIIKITPDGSASTFAANIDGPRGLAFDGQGILYVAVAGNDNIAKITPSGASSLFATNVAGGPGYGDDLAFDPSGNLFVSVITSSGDWIQKYTPQAVSSLFAGGMLNPYHIAFDSAGSLYVANFGQFDAKNNSVNSSIKKITPDDTVTTFAGPPTTDTPNGIAVWPGLLPVKAGAPAGQLLNISTRMEVLTGNNVLIGGFIITGSDQKKVLIRGLGPSLPVSGALADPTLELHDSNATLATNDNWKDTQQADIQATTIPPSNDSESAMVQTLNGNNAGYTAILAGKNGGTGIGLVEVYDVTSGANSQLANISTRGFVDTGNNVLIGGLIAGPGSASTSTIVVRAIGPSLQASGVSNALQDPMLELHDGSGALVASNDNWKDTQQQEVVSSHLAPSDDRESVIVRILSPGNYTAVVRGKNNTTGVGLVEAYNLH